MFFILGVNIFYIYGLKVGGAHSELISIQFLSGAYAFYK